MISVEQALERVLAQVPLVDIEEVSVAEAANRVVRADIHSNTNLPAFDNSAVDGYAVRSDDVRSASAAAPVMLRVSFEVAAGAAAALAVEPHAAARIFTGSPLPRGADAVVMQEDTAREGEWVKVLDAVRPFENVRMKGEDVKRGDLLVKAGEWVTASAVGLLGGCGESRVKVGCRPKVGVLATGNELQEPGNLLEPGQIYESNRITIAALADKAGGIARSYPIVRDTLTGTSKALEKAFAECDVVVTSGGVSVGEHDHVKAAFEVVGGKIDFWRVAMRPGKPFVFGTIGKKLLFGLPGNPVSAFVTFLLLVRPALLRMLGANDVRMQTAYGRVADPLRNDGDRRHFVRVTLGKDGMIRSAGPQASHMLRSLGKANALLDMRPGLALTEGEIVPVLLW